MYTQNKQVAGWSDLSVWNTLTYFGMDLIRFSACFFFNQAICWPLKVIWSQFCVCLCDFFTLILNWFEVSFVLSKLFVFYWPVALGINTFVINHVCCMVIIHVCVCVCVPVLCTSYNMYSYIEKQKSGKIIDKKVYATSENII